MSLLIAGIVAGAGGLMANKSANEADKAEAEAKKFQDLIDVERMASDVALRSYNDTLQLSQLESQQIAQSSAMGKRSDSASLVNIQEVGRADLETNIDRMDDEVARSRKYGEVSASARDRSVKSRSNARNISTITSGLMIGAKAL